MTLTIENTYEGKALPGAAFALYQAGTVDAYGKITLTGPFASYPVSTEGLDLDGWNALALTLSGYVQRDQLPARDRGVTGADGQLRFPTAPSVPMKPGLYLVIGTPCTVDHHIYTAAPFLVFLPEEDVAHNTWNYDGTARPKNERQEETLSRGVVKVWEDANRADQRPDAITVRLLKDGTVYDTVTLTRENGWRHAWDGLPARFTWTVAEQEVPGYTVRVEQEGDTYTVTNTALPADPPPIPRTGQLWWPVPLLGGAGLLLLLSGTLKRRRGR